ncbi:uncharacterized protein LOC111046688 isoform X1 [Nilaparvata lugens]|uniref:uncharacterized protein LOC111046688 isoform X1 n=1 Tax=Nilaparvata lugens TaxID=108931 RepID=UPI000B988896|nr:uncharacterized protein LOC111046688 isoform X1 [Nilaparvata lugens]
MKAAKRPKLNRSRPTRSKKSQLLDPVEVLLPELTERIFSCLPLKDLNACSAVSRRWHEAASNDRLWRGLCKRRNWFDCGTLDKCIDCFQSLQNDITHISNLPNWRKHFVLKNQLKRNWFKGNYQKCKILLTIDRIASITCVDSCNMVLAYGCNNGEVRVYNIKEPYKLLQTIQCKDDSPIDAIRISENYLVYTQSLMLYVFKLSRRGIYRFCSIKSMRTEEVVEINSSLKHIGVNLVKNVAEHNGENELPFFQQQALFGVKFLLVGDSLIAATSTSPFIHVWDLASPSARECQVFELDEETEVGDICVANNTLYMSLIVKDEKKEMPKNPFRWYIQAFAMDTFRQLYRSEVHRYDDVAIPALEASNSYVVVSFRPGHIFLFDRHDGSLLYHDSTLVFLDARPENSDFIGVKHNDCLLIYNPKTKSTIASVDLGGSPWGIYHDVLITVSTSFDRFGRGIPYMEFWWLKKKKYLSYGPILVLTFRSLSNLVFMDETKVVLFVENRFLYIITFMA